MYGNIILKQKQKNLKINKKRYLKSKITSNSFPQIRVINSAPTNEAWTLLWRNSRWWEKGLEISSSNLKYEDELWSLKSRSL